MFARLLRPYLTSIASVVLFSFAASAGPELPPPANAAILHDKLVRIFVASDLCPNINIDKYKLRALIIKMGATAGWTYSQRPEQVE